MKKPITDRMVALIAERGPEGASSTELAETFLHPAGAPAALYVRLIRQVLTGDPRVSESPEGHWIAQSGPATAMENEGYAVIEVTEARTGAGSIIIEWAGIHVDSRGRIGGQICRAIRPDPRPPDLIVPHRLEESMRGAPTLQEAVAEATAFTVGAVLVSASPGRFHAALTSDGPTATLNLCRLARQLFGSRVRSTESLAAHLGITLRDPETAADRALYTAELLAALLAHCREFELADPDTWTERQRPERVDVDFSHFDFDREHVAGLPECPGVYIMRDANGNAVYVGKAANLRGRVASYFRARVQRDEKTERILEATSQLDILRAGSELEALLMEYRQIQELQPDINIQYDVHERETAAKETERRLVLVLPSVEEGKAEVFLVRGMAVMAQHQVPKEDMDPLRAEMAALFFSEPPSTEESPTEELRIIWSWFQRNRDTVNAFDVDAAGGLDGAVRLLGQYLREEASGERVFHV